MIKEIRKEENVVKNIALILSGGKGERFNSDIPKQYLMINDFPVIHYVIKACKSSKTIDKIVVVADKKYYKLISANSNDILLVESGETRNYSLGNGLEYIHDHFPHAAKLMTLDADNPLVSGFQIDMYLGLLDSYDHVMTATKVTSALARYDGKKVLSNDFFETLSPEAFRFNILYDHHNPKSLTPPWHSFGDNIKSYACFDYPYNMKITYEFDLDIVSLLLEKLHLKSYEM